MIYIIILYDLHNLYVTLCWKTLQVGICLLSTQSTQQGITPCFGGVGAQVSGFTRGEMALCGSKLSLRMIFGGVRVTEHTGVL